MRRTNKTKAKIQFNKILKNHPYPIELSEIHRLVAKKIPGVAFSTIYRIARDLEKKGKITRADWRERGSKYEWLEGREHHHHITCVVCGEIRDINDDCLCFSEQEIKNQTGFILKDHHFELEGICPQCDKEEAS